MNMNDYKKVTDRIQPSERCKDEVLNMSRNRRKITHKLNKKAAAAIITVAVAACGGTAVFAAYRANKVGVQKTAPYQNTITVTPDENYTANTQYMDFEITFFPEGFYGTVGDNLHYENENGGSFKPIFYRTPYDGKVTEKLDFSADYEEYDDGDKNVIINYRVSYDAEEASPENYGREVWIFWGETPYFMQIFVSDDVSDEDLRAIISGIVLVPSDEEKAGIWFDRTVDSGSGNYNPNPETYRDNLELYGVGESYIYNDTNFIEIGAGNLDLEVSFNDAWLQENFDGITTDSCGWDADYSMYLDENGKIIDNECTLTILGDGVNTLNEAVGTEIQPLRLLVIDMTFTNMGDEDGEFIVSPNMFSIIDDAYMSNLQLVTHRDGYFAVNSVPEFGNGENISFDSPNKFEKNYVRLAPGESTDVKISYLVRDDMLGNLYINMTGESITHQIPILDLCDIK